MKNHSALPKPARDRLTRDQRASAGVHPDADLLNAFTEGALGEAERTRVMDHISRCGGCREIVFLAAPDAIAGRAPDLVLVANRWRKCWRKLVPAITAAVAVVVVGSAVLMHRPHTSAPLTRSVEVEAKKEIPASPSQQVQSATPQADAQRDSRAGQASKKQVDTRIDTAAVATANKPQAGQPIAPADKDKSQFAFRLQTQPYLASGPHGPLEAKGNSMNYQNVAVTPARTVPVMPVTGGALRQVQPSQAAPRQAPANSGTVVGGIVAASAPAKTPQRAASDKKFAAPAPDAVEVTAEASNAQTAYAVPTEPAAGLAKAAAVHGNQPIARAHWRITPEGKLQRSFAGENWTAVLANAKFRVVSVTNNDVWAGGERGDLYHSQDAGAHWLRVIVTDGINTADEPIVGIHFRDAQNGEITMQDGTAWKTSDGGARWIRR